MSQSDKNTSWQNVSGWYNKLVQKEGHYYHQSTIIPKSLPLLNLTNSSSLLDLGCGQGVLARHIPKTVFYLGVDASPGLIEFAKKQDKNSNHVFMVGDITHPLDGVKKEFTHASIILALQNIQKPRDVLLQTNKFLKPDGKLLIVLNHPCFRIPRQSAWGVDESTKIQYRRINRYLSPLKIPINMHPGDKQSPVTWSFHFPLSFYSDIIYSAGFDIIKIEEWVSDKKSIGKAAKMENRSRSEFPMFMAILAGKVRSV